VSGAHLAAVTAAITAGVLLPKAVPAALVGGRFPPWASRFLRLLPVAILGALVVVTMLGPGRAAVPGWPVVLGVTAATVVAVVTRRSLLSMAVGWTVMAVAMLLG
jgi:branched-subunit amino acid transport protein